MHYVPGINYAYALQQHVRAPHIPDALSTKVCMHGKTRPACDVPNVQGTMQRLHMLTAYARRYWVGKSGRPYNMTKTHKQNGSNRTFVVQASQDIERVERKASSIVEVRAQHAAHGVDPHGPALLRLVAPYQVLIWRR